MAGIVLENVNQAHKYVVDELGFQVSYNTLKKHLVDLDLAAKRRGGGWTGGALKTYAEGNLVKKVDDAPEADKPAGKSPVDPAAAGAATKRTAAHAKKLEIQALREENRLRQELGELIEAATFERELARRAQVFRFGLESFAHQAGEDLADLFGGRPDLAAEIVGLVAKALAGGEDQAEAAQHLQAWFAGRVPEFVQEWLQHVDRFLEPYSSGDYYTDEMAAAMKTREEQHAGADA